MRRPLAAIVLLLAPLGLGWALGDPEGGTFQPVQGLENWNARLDLAGQKAGKYNIVVRGTDEAGNVRYDGPYNLFIDPASDLPVVHISYPTPGARVSTVLHVVGTSLDDDGVKAVQVQLDGGDPAPAEGLEFWSFALEVSSIADGEHTVSARAIDANGVEGKPQSVRFQVDKRGPLVRVTSHASGSLVSGVATLEGQVADANGLASLGVSRDGGKSFQPVRVSLDKSARQGTFRISLDTRRMSDGPQVLLFRAFDRTGSVGRFAFLLFVNNDAPVLEILFPAEGAAVNGKVMVAGKASDKIGLRSLRYDMGGGEKGEVALTPGNPFWTQEIDLSARKAGGLVLTYTLENLTGNRKTQMLRLRVNPEADRPRLTLAFPPQGAKISGEAVVFGSVQDDDGVDHVEYSLDGAAAQTVAAAAAFSFPLGEIAAGQHKLTMKAVDVGGVESGLVQRSFVSTGGPPSITVASLTGSSGSQPFSPGILVADKDARLSGSIKFSGTSVQATYRLQGAAARGLALKSGAERGEGERSFELPFPQSLSPGRADLTITATDGFGNTAEYRTFLFMGAEQQEPGIILVDGRFSPEGMIRLDERPLSGYLVGGTIGKVELDPQTDLVGAEVEGQLFRMVPASQGVSQPTRIRVTGSDGSTWATDPIVFVTDFSPPDLKVERPAIGEWARSELAVAGTATDAGGMAAIEYSLDGGGFLPIEAKAEAGTEAGATGAAGAAPATASPQFLATVPLAGMADGPHLLSLRATDRAGNARLVQLPFQTDLTAPKLLLVAPRPQDEVNGTITLAGTVEEAGTIARVEASEDGESFHEVAKGPVFRFDVSLSKLGESAGKLSVRCTDAAGNSSDLAPQLALNLAADKPVAQIQVPADGELVRDDFVLSGMVFDDDGVQTVLYRIDEGEFQRLPGGNNFSVPVSLEALSDNEHTVEVKAEDIGGLPSDLARARFMVSRSDPVSSLESPRISEHLRDVVELKGTSRDPNGIAEVRISFDNGLSFFRADGAESWRYRLDTRLLADGTRALLVKAVDSTGAEGLYTTTMNIDNRAPELVIDSPADGQVATETLHLDGRAVDNIGLASLSVSLTPIGETGEKPVAADASGSAPGGTGGTGSTAGTGGTSAPAKGIEVSPTAGGVLAEEIDLRSLAPGWYNLQVEAIDRAGNRSYVSRNFPRRPSPEAERVELFYPSGGERIAGYFAVSGRVVAKERPEGKNVLVTVDGQPLDTARLNREGYFRLDVGPEELAGGDHTIVVEATLAEGGKLSSEPRVIQYAKDGPWVAVNSFASGDYVTGRPFLQGKAGWVGETTETAAGDATARAADARAAAARAQRRVRMVEVSMDNGTSFQRAEGGESWRYRLEAQQIPNGALRLLVRATFAGGQTAVTRTQLTVDTRAPELSLLEPKEGGRFNESVQLAGSASDESGLKEVAVSLRAGDKSQYKVPTFIQGLYVDAHAMGATTWDVGMGLTFLDDNIKLQLQIGLSPLGRFSGLVIGTKLLANIATVPFSYLFGPSWDFFSMSLAVGANFSYFTMSENAIAFTDAGLVLGGIVAQLEFARFAIARWRVFNTWSLYSEYQLWFISSDVQAGTVSKLSFGMRVGLL